MTNIIEDILLFVDIIHQCHSQYDVIESTSYLPIRYALFTYFSLSTSILYAIATIVYNYRALYIENECSNNRCEIRKLCICGRIINENFFDEKLTRSRACTIDGSITHTAQTCSLIIASINRGGLVPNFY